MAHARLETRACAGGFLLVLVVLVVVLVVLALVFSVPVAVVACHYFYQSENHRQDHLKHHQDHQNHHRDN